MTSRRRFLAGLGTGAIGVMAGCAAFAGVNDESEDRLRSEDFSEWAPETLVMPSSLPISLPDELFETQENRTRDLLEAVPEDPKIPNSVIENDITEQRETVRTRVEDGSDADTDAGRLKNWHGFRTDAAELFGSYRAATGADDASILNTRREEIRNGLAAFEAALDYSAASTVEAALVYDLIEDRLERAKSDIPPYNPYPTDPAANVEQAGRAFESVESAAAALAEARGVQNAYESAREETASRWSDLADTVRWLEISVSRTRSRRVPDPETADSETVFEFELSGVERDLFRFTRQNARYSIESVRESREDGRFATAVIMAGRSLVSIAAFDGVITALRNGNVPEEQSVETVQSAADDAYDSLRGLPTVGYPFLNAAIGKPAVWDYRSGIRSLSENRFDPEYAEASFRHASLVGSATPAAASFIVDQLEAGR